MNLIQRFQKWVSNFLNSTKQDWLKVEFVAQTANYLPHYGDAQFSNETMQKTKHNNKTITLLKNVKKFQGIYCRILRGQ